MRWESHIAEWWSRRHRWCGTAVAGVGCWSCYAWVKARPQGTQSAKQLRHTDYFPKGPFCLLHCYALRRNKRSNYCVAVTWGSGFKVAKKLCIYFIYTLRYVFVLFVLVIHLLNILQTFSKTPIDLHISIWYNKYSNRKEHLRGLSIHLHLPRLWHTIY